MKRRGKEVERWKGEKEEEMKRKRGREGKRRKQAKMWIDE